MLSLTHEHITQALLTSDDEGETLNLANWGFTDVSETSGEELASIGKSNPDGIGIVTRIALNSNALSDLPRSLELITRLRYLNLRANAFTAFPSVLTALPKLEILDLSRNSITELPPHPGTLTNLNVFSLARNLITRLPVYFTDFEWLRVLKLEGNPITWPPPDVWNRDRIENDSDAQTWLNELKAWLLVHADSEGQENEDVYKHSSDDEVLVARTLLARSGSSASNYAFQHERSYSTDSEISLTSFDSKPSEALEPAFIPAIAPSSSFTTLPIQKEPPASHHFDPSPAELSAFASHVRGISYSVETSTKASRRRTQMLGKKSMPNLRSSSRNDFPAEQPSYDRPPSVSSTKMPTSLADPPVPKSSASVGPSRAKVSKEPYSARSDESSVPIDEERNHYFRRVSALPKPRGEAPQKMPQSLLQTVDAIRGILFSLSQIYSAVRNYTASAIDERTSSVLIKVLDPASSYLSGLINALEQFDNVSERGGLPGPETCRTLIVSCRDNVAVFGKVAGVLQLQLKVLASSHDPRYTRTLLLMLYGSMAEISNSWQAMLPLLPSLVPLLQSRRRLRQQRDEVRHEQRHEPPLSNGTADVPRPLRLDGNAAGKYAGNTVASTLEKTPSPPSTASVNNSADSGSYSRRTLAARARRQGGSFSGNDVAMGRTLPSPSPSEASYPASTSSPVLGSPVLNQRPSATRTGSTSAIPQSHPYSHQPHSSSLSKQYSPLQPPSLPFASSSRSHSRGQSNSSSGSIPSPSLTNTSLAPPPSLSSLPSVSPLTQVASPYPGTFGVITPNSPQLSSVRSRSRAGDYSSPYSVADHYNRNHSNLRPSTDGSMQTSVTTSRLVDADLLAAMELATNHAQVVWTMLGDILKANENDGSHIDGGGSRRQDEQLWEALERVQAVTTKMMAYFSEARDGDSEAGKKALGEDAHMFVKATVQILVLLKTFATTHALPHRLRESVTNLTAAMQDVTVFLHVSSYAPTPTPVPPSATFSTHVGSMGPSGTNSPRSFSPATFLHNGASPTTPLPNNGLGIGFQSNLSNGGYSYSSGDERSFNSGGLGVAGPGLLGRSKSATAGPTPLKIGSSLSSMSGSNGERDPPLTALPQNQAFRFG